MRTAVKRSVDKLSVLELADQVTGSRAASAAIASMDAPPDAEVVFRLGRALTIAGRSNAAICQLEHAFLIATGEGKPQIVADALDLLTWLAWIELDGKRTRSYAKKLFKLDLPTASAEAFRVRIRQTTIALQLGDAREALRLLDEAENVSRVADIDSFTSYLMLLGDVHAGLGEAEVAKLHALEGVSSRRELLALLASGSIRA